MSKGGSGGGAGTVNQGSTPVRTTDGVSYKKSDAAIANGDVAVKVSVDKLDKAWQKDAGGHIPKGGTGGQGRAKADAAKATVASGKTVEMPRANFSKGRVRFTDGRHRTAAVRDSGKKTMYVTVPRGQAKTVKRRLGAD
jgi:hypothetical protein